MTTAPTEQHERECAVCMNDFTTPKILPCGHLLCRECVVSWMDTKPHAGCPLCRCPIVEHQEHSAPCSSDVADCLPTDYVMEALVQNSVVLTKNRICCVCDGVKADFLCVQCMDLLCSWCSRAHKKLSATRSHDVESLSTVTPERLAASRPALCADHGEEQAADRFCVSHNIAICSSCTLTKHQTCSDVKDMNTVMASAVTSLTNLTDILSSAEQKLEGAVTQLKSRLQEVAARERESIAQVDKACSHVQRMFEDCRSKFKLLTIRAHTEINCSIQDTKTALVKRLGEVTSHKRLVGRAMLATPRPALIHATSALHKRINSLDLKVDLQQDCVRSLPRLGSCHELERQIIKDISVVVERKKILVTSQPTFHTNRGDNIVLLQNKTAAELVAMDKTLFSMGGLVVLREAMAQDCVYQIRVDKMNRSWNSNYIMYYGVTGTHPSSLKIEEHIYQTNFIIVKKLGDYITSLEEGSVIGLMIDSSNDLHLYLNGENLGVAEKNIPRPSYAVFDLNLRVVKVTALPVLNKTTHRQLYSIV